MPATITTQTATYMRNKHVYWNSGSTYTGYDSAALAAKRFAQALASLGWTISVVEDTTAEYDENLSPYSQPAQNYLAHACDTEYNIGIYINGRNEYNQSYKSPNYYGWSAWFRTGPTSNGMVPSGQYSANYCFDVGTWTITKQSFGSFVKYIFPLSSSSYTSAGGVYYHDNSSLVGSFVTLCGFKAVSLLTGEVEAFGTAGVRSTAYWFVGTPCNTVSLTYHQSTGHTSATPQPSADKTLLWQTPLYCGEQLYDKINGGRLFRISGSSELPAGADFTVGSSTMRALDTSWALELI